MAGCRLAFHSTNPTKDTPQELSQVQQLNKGKSMCRVARIFGWWGGGGGDAVKGSTLDLGHASEPMKISTAPP